MSRTVDVESASEFFLSAETPLLHASEYRARKLGAWGCVLENSLDMMEALRYATRDYHEYARQFSREPQNYSSEF